MAMHPPIGKEFMVDDGRTLLPGEVPTDGGGRNLPTHVQRNGSEEVKPKLNDPLTSAARIAWQRFNGHSRGHIGFLQSLKAVTLSSCTSVPIVVTLLDSFQTHRLEPNANSRTTCLGFSLSTMGPKVDICMCVPFFGLKFIHRLMDWWQYASSLLFLWKNSSIGVGSKWQYISDRPLVICS